MDQAFALKLRDYLSRHFEDQISLIVRLCESESPTTEPGSQEQVFRILHDALEPLGFRNRILGGKTSGGQFLAYPDRPRRIQPCQMLLGHVDTVWPLGTLDRMPVRREGSILRGPGVFDMKAGLAQAVFALKALRHFQIEPPVTPVLFFTSDEELGSEDSRSRIEKLARRMLRVLVLEPAAGFEGKLKTARKGTGVFQVEVEGISAHAGVEPEKGVSAILEMAGIIQRLHQLNDPARGISVSVGTVAGGTRVNVIPAHASAAVDVRVSTVEDGRTIEQSIRSLKARLPGAVVRISGLMDRPPLERSPRNRALWHQAVEMARLIDLELGETETGGGSDGNLTSPWTATLDGLGAVGGGAHADHEFIDLDRGVERTALLALLLAAPPCETNSSPRGH